MASIDFTESELAALAAKLKPYLNVSPPPDVGINPPPVVVPPPPPPPPVATISARWDSAPGQWAKWMFVTPTEQSALITTFGSTPVMQRINWYHSYHILNGLYDDKTNTYKFVADTTWWGTPVWADDVGGAADAKHLADLKGVPEISPLG